MKLEALWHALYEIAAATQLAKVDSPLSETPLETIEKNMINTPLAMKALSITIVNFLQTNASVQHIKDCSNQRTWL